jgi:hypothetical protein
MSIIIGSLQTKEYKNNFITDKFSYSNKQAVDYNILHDYRSYNYVITLFAIPAQKYNDPNYFKTLNGDPDYVILKSSGKGKREIQADASTDVLVAAQNEETGDPYTKLTANPDLSALLDDFNKNGYGRFDFFIDNLEIDLTWNITTGAQPGQIKFEVVEPYSINGFIEALRINALAAGYENHNQAIYVLKIEFVGYKYDKNGNLTEPEKIPKSTRYIPININQMSLETSERGTVYRVAAAPRNNMGYGEDGKLATTVKMSGVTVGDVFTSLAKQLTDTRKSDTGQKEPKHFNEFKVVFQDENGKEIANPNDSKIGGSKINEELRSDQVYTFPEISDNNPKSSYQSPDPPKNTKYDSTKETISFGSQHSILDVMTAVIRDSQYSVELLGKLDTIIKEKNGLVDWFRVYLKTEMKPEINPTTQNHNYIYTYTIRPFKFHYSRLPGMGSGLFDGDELRGQIRRSYNYLYSGKNVDILNFNLKVNGLFFQQRPFNMGNKDTSGTKQAQGASEQQKLEEKETPADAKNEDQKQIPIRVATDAASLDRYGLNGKAPQASPYMKLAQIMHEHLCDSVDFNTIDLQIVGDPYYLVSSNMGNQEEDVDPATPAINSDGSAPWLGGTVFIDLFFRTIKDIKPDGMGDFGNLLPFSGIYQVNRVVCNFREGRFEQRLNCLRLAGQVVNEKRQNVYAVPLESTVPGEAKTIDSAISSVARSGIKPNNAQLMNIISRGLPTAGLPGLLANFTNSVGGAIGGVGTALQTTLQRVDDTAKGLLAPVNSLLQQAQAGLNFAAQVGGLVAIGNALVNGYDSPNPTPGIGQAVGGYNPYTTGIRLDTNGLNNILTGDSQSNQAIINAQNNIISSVVQDPTNIDLLNTFNYFNNFDQRLSANDTQINAIGNSIDQVMLATPNDPRALAAKLGIDPAQLSGLSSDQQSSIFDRMLEILKNVPENTDIAGLKSLGISLANISGASIANLPALQPLTTSPIANIPAIDLQKIIATGGKPSNLPGALDIPAVAELSKFIDSARGVPSNGILGGAGQLNSQSITDKYATVQQMNISSNKGSVESQSAGIGNTVQGYFGNNVDPQTAYAQYGSQQTLSPIDKLMQTKT